MKPAYLALSLTVASALFGCSPNDANTVSAAGSTPAVVAPVNETGKKVYGATCAMCHAAGVGGAPKPGDKSDWAPRIAQGMDVVYKHAQDGFTGTKGMMPARGSNPALTDDELKAAVDYMIGQTR